MRLVAKRADSELLFYAESEADFVGWVKALSATMRELADVDAAEIELQQRTEAAIAESECRCRSAIRCFELLLCEVRVNCLVHCQLLVMALYTH
jgi:hypothetical protein